MKPGRKKLFIPRHQRSIYFPMALWEKIREYAHWNCLTKTDAVIELVEYAFEQKDLPNGCK